MPFQLSLTPLSSTFLPKSFFFHSDDHTFITIGGRHLRNPLPSPDNGIFAVGLAPSTAEITFHGGSFTIRDTASDSPRDGTLLNGDSLRYTTAPYVPTPLTDGDRLDFGYFDTSYPDADHYYLDPHDFVPLVSCKVTIRRIPISRTPLGSIFDTSSSSFASCDHSDSGDDASSAPTVPPHSAHTPITPSSSPKPPSLIGLQPKPSSSTCSGASTTGADLASLDSVPGSPPTYKRSQSRVAPLLTSSGTFAGSDDKGTFSPSTLPTSVSTSVLRSNQHPPPLVSPLRGTAVSSSILPPSTFHSYSASGKGTRSSGNVLSLPETSSHSTDSATTALDRVATAWAELRRAVLGVPLSFTGFAAGSHGDTFNTACQGLHSAEVALQRVKDQLRDCLVSRLHSTFPRQSRSPMVDIPNRCDTCPIIADDKVPSEALSVPSSSPSHVPTSPNPALPSTNTSGSPALIPVRPPNACDVTSAFGTALPASTPVHLLYHVATSLGSALYVPFFNASSALATCLVPVPGPVPFSSPASYVPSSLITSLRVLVPAS
ncbi:hypothetical protein CF319_g5911 [Tilletia indica]|uniref:Uncharacterized protein n=1 Tax=Tilletia indica TaxID=43049 RepID=A0A177TKH3_9BASI|nr:hypothetical protein CF319_g5911 [Tilletia indica]KAE8236720.1 hypothetical protein A4X13_0g9051 [Tilletia indica]